MGLIFGFDIGIASVGWAVVDSSSWKVVESGSNLFESADASNNVERRGNLQLKIIHRRHRTRINDFNKLWEKQVGTIPNYRCNFPLELRVKGLNNPLTKDELYFALLHELQHRGISYLEDAIEEGAASNYANSILINQKELDAKYPCEIQNERLQRYGQYRGQINTFLDGEEVVLSNVFTTSAYVKEIEKIFSVQLENNLVSKEFTEAYLKIFKRKRKYYEGPGNELSRTDYGKYTTKIDPATGEYITDENIFDKLIGKCSIYPDLRRASAVSYTAQEFNALNDLNNLTVNGRKLEEDEKHAIIDAYLAESTVKLSAKKVRTIISKAIGEPIEEMTGARIDKSEEELFHTLECFRKMKKACDEAGISLDEYSRDDLDQIAHILTINTDKEAIVNAFNDPGLELTIALSEDAIETFCTFRKANGAYFGKWHSFSARIMNELIPVMYEEPKEQMTLLTEGGYIKSSIDKLKGLKKIPTEDLLEEVYIPVVRRSVNIAIRILNDLLKKYGNPEQIVIEMPRDRNSDEQAKRIKDFQKNREKELKDIEKRIKDEYGRELTEKDYRNHKGLVLKLKLWNEQNGFCLYSGDEIDVNELIDHPEKFEVDHIIPLSISLDDGRNKKVLVYASQNKAKGNNTPYQYLSYAGGKHLDYDTFKANVLRLKKDKRIPDKKVKNFLFTQDIYKYDVVQGFINRNLNDTTYASRLVLNSIQDFFRANELDTKVKVIRGAFTNQMRQGLNLPKDREESFAHHAIDAALICFAQMGYSNFLLKKSEIIDLETGEILDTEHESKILSEDTFKSLLYRQRMFEINQELTRAEKEVKFWHRIDKKPNRKLSDATIYGTREHDGKIYKIGKVSLRDKDFMKNHWGKKDFLMKELDPQTFAILEKIAQDYKDAVNPFVQYEKETGQTICKYSKKGNGPKIVDLKYRAGEVGSCIDISHKYGHEAGSKKVILDSINPFRMDVFYNSNTNQYHLIGIKYSMCKFEKGKYVINLDQYTKELIREKVLSENNTWEDLEKLGIEFRLSFYKNEIIRYEKNGEYFTERFLSRTMPNQANYIETKPINKDKFDKRNLIGLSKTNMIAKIRTDILGNQYQVTKEKFSLDIE